jgi:hypothetical protein
VESVSVLPGKGHKRFYTVSNIYCLRARPASQTVALVDPRVQHLSLEGPANRTFHKPTRVQYLLLSEGSKVKMSDIGPTCLNIIY